MPLSKRTLGVTYLVGTGMVLMTVLLVRFFFRKSPASDPFEVLSGVLLSVSLVYAGYWLADSTLEDEHVWTVSKWGALGLALPTLVTLAVVSRSLQPGGWEFVRGNLFASSLAAGGVVGVLVGGIKELHAQHEEARHLNERNQVLLRVLRHNIRNDMNVILGYVDQIDDGPASADALDIIRDRAAEVADLGEKARRIEDTLNGEGRDDAPVDLVAAVERHLDDGAMARPGVTVTADLPEEAWVRADPGLDLLVRNLFDGVLRHNDADETVLEVSVRAADESVALDVVDNGSGIPCREREALTAGEETPLDHGSGLELWLVRWLVDRYDGELVLDPGTADGGAVRVWLPRVAPRVLSLWADVGPSSSPGDGSPGDPADGDASRQVPAPDGRGPGDR